METGQLCLRRGWGGRGLTPPTHWTLEEPLCEQDCNPGWRDCFGQMTSAIPWFPWFPPLWPHVPVTALKPLQALVLLSQFQSWPLLHGKVGSIPASLLGQKTLTGLPQGPRDPRIPPVISTLPHPHPSPGCILRVTPSQGSCRGLLFQLLYLKRGDHPSIPTPSLDALKDYTSASDTASMFISNPFFPAWKLLSSLLGRENPAQVGLLLDLSRLPLGWQPWSPTLC